ncbi:Hypothetical_protein [Hexamita inflata]|uniref:Hypothetical_protein n=1 Tax=Hexamita inflata TaxID=28002 RepID=A0AA86UK94_9EUKA|nr:Hypothetical protein HINF_LOCUS42077 [Hexamita inflata]
MRIDQVFTRKYLIEVRNHVLTFYISGVYMRVYPRVFQRDFTVQKRDIIQINIIVHSTPRVFLSQQYSGFFFFSLHISWQSFCCPIHPKSQRYSLVHLDRSSDFPLKYNQSLLVYGRYSTPSASASLFPAWSDVSFSITSKYLQRYLQVTLFLKLHASSKTCLNPDSHQQVVQLYQFDHY